MDGKGHASLRPYPATIAPTGASSTCHRRTVPSNVAGLASGQYMAFMSDRSLTGYDNIDAHSGQPDEEVFVYDAAANTLACASATRPERDR